MALIHSAGSEGIQGGLAAAGARELEWLSHHHSTAAELRRYRLVQLLKMKADLKDKYANVPLNSAQYIHLTAEIEKRVFAIAPSILATPISTRCRSRSSSTTTTS